MIDKTRWPLNADLFPKKENMSMTSEIVQGHSDVGLREELKNIWNETTPVWRHVCVQTSGYWHCHVHDKNVSVKIRVREYDWNSIGEL